MKRRYQHQHQQQQPLDEWQFPSFSSSSSSSSSSFSSASGNTHGRHYQHKYPRHHTSSSSQHKQHQSTFGSSSSLEPSFKTKHSAHHHRHHPLVHRHHEEYQTVSLIDDIKKQAYDSGYRDGISAALDRHRQEKRRQRENMEPHFGDGGLSSKSVRSVDLLMLYPPVSSHRQCHACGLRVALGDDMTYHMDKHFQENKHLESVRQDKFQLPSRQWMLPKEQWMMSPNQIKVIKEQLSKQRPEQLLKCQPQEPPLVVVVDDDNDLLMCTVCGMDLAQKWNDDVDAWVYKDKVVRVQDGGGVVHNQCL
jgi:hypothetical protein